MGRYLVSCELGRAPLLTKLALTVLSAPDWNVRPLTFAVAKYHLHDRHLLARNSAAALGNSRSPFSLLCHLTELQLLLSIDFVVRNTTRGWRCVDLNWRVGRLRCILGWRWTLPLTRCIYWRLGMGNRWRSSKGGLSSICGWPLGSRCCTDSGRESLRADLGT